MGSFDWTPGSREVVEGFARQIDAAKRELGSSPNARTDFAHMVGGRASMRGLHVLEKAA